MAENDSLNPMPDKALADMNSKLSSSNQILKELKESTADSGESIGELLKAEKNLLETMKENTKSIKEIADSNKKMALAAEEEKREAKIAGKAGSVGFGKELQDSMKEAMKMASPLYAGATNPIMTALKDVFKGSSLLGGNRGLLGFGSATQAGQGGAGILGTIAGGASGFLIGFLTPVIKSYQTLFKSFYTAISPVIEGLGSLGKAAFNTFMETFPLADELRGIGKYFGEASSIIKNGLLAVIKGIGGVIDYGLVMLRSVFGSSVPRLKTILSFFGDLFTSVGAKFSSFFSADGILYGTMKVINNLFGEGALNVFVKAYEFGGQLAKYLPFLTVIPTAIETIIAAFDKFETEGFKGVFKTIMVGLLKGVAAFFTLGLSDLALDFEKMYSVLSDSLDGIFSELSGFFDLFVDVFGWVFDTVMGLWEGILKPIFVSLYEDAIKPLMEALSAVGDFVMILFDVVVTFLKPVLAIARFVFKLVFEVVKLIYDFVVYPIISLLVPIFKVLFKTIGILLTPVTALFQILTIVVGNFWNKFLKPIVNFITDLFSAGAEMGSLSDLIRNALAYWGEIIKAGWDFIIGYYEMIVDTIADAMLWWWELITDTWDYVYGLWDKLTDMLAYGMLWWWDAIKAAWDYVYNLWDQTTSLLAEGMLIWAGWIQEGWNYVVGIWEDLTDALAYGLLWWSEKITGAMNYVIELWEFAVDALAESLEPIVSPIMDFFDFVGNIFTTLKGYASSLFSWLPGMGGGETTAEATTTTAGDPAVMSERMKMKRQQKADEKEFLSKMGAAEQEDPGMKERLRSQMSAGGGAKVAPEEIGFVSSGNARIDERRRERLRDKRQFAEMIAREEAEYGKDGAAALRAQIGQQMAAAGGAAGGAGITNRMPSVVINSSPTTNISGGGGGGGAAIPVPISPNPIRHSDPTRGLIAN